MEIRGAPRLQLSAQTRVEAGITTTSASGGTLVQLQGQYIAARDRQATVVNTSGAYFAVIDRILLYPQTALALFFSIAGGGDEYLFQRISNASRVMASGDFVEYDVWIDAASPQPIGGDYSQGLLYLHFTDTTDSLGASWTGANDAAGHHLSLALDTMDVLARGKWYSRKVAVPAGVIGKTLDSVALLCPSNADGDYRVLYRNIRITDGAGTDRQVLWSTGEPVVNTTLSQSGASNVRCGPANSILLYALNSVSGAQAAKDVSWGITAF
jgi:hypothetical protein